ncbi:helix-turn-helix transcriptional regulator [Herpetosiphon giganteus]|uniref:helix-turn-helix transcriptional regulator n=1 Tax=Herpetosiphon giganteus TaxID=2029754 RepID=UPI001EF925D7|nr:YafY family protein [Herpetosiphon giganteus]MBM7845147.1 putative DNA-binding transcriptional regulator YafY [Herpetosiphon giganteus]
MEKVERLIAITMILLQKERVSATEFAQLFQVSKRTILRDMQTLSMANIPIYALTGVNGGYGILDTYKVDKRLLSSADLQHLLTALAGLEQLILTAEIAQTIKKIEAMVGPLGLNRSMQLLFYAWEGRAELRESLKICQTALVKERLVAFDYTDKAGVQTQRIVEPYALHFSESSWYLQGFCLDRQGYRSFKLARMGQLRMDRRGFQQRADWSVHANAAHANPQFVTIKALVAPSIHDQIIERYGRSSIEAATAEYGLATMYVPQNPQGFQLLASFGTQIKVLEPQSYVAEFRTYLAQMLQNYA